MPPKSRAAAADPASSPVALLAGKDDFLVERAIDRVMAVARQTDPQIERRVISGGADDSGAVAALADALAPTLFGDSAVVVVLDADQFEEAGQKALLDAVAEIGSGGRDGIRLLIHHPVSVKAKKLLDTLRKDNNVVQVECAPMKYRAVDEFISNEFTTLRRKVTPEAVEALRSSVGDDLRSLSSAIHQLCSDVPDGAITAEHVGLYHSGVADVPGYEVADSVMEARPEELVRRVRWALENDGGATPALTGATANGLRSLVRYAEARRLPEPEAARVVGVPPFKLKALGMQLRKWNPGLLAAATRLLAAADLAAKGQTPDGKGLENAQRQHAVESALLRIAAKDLGQD